MSQDILTIAWKSMCRRDFTTAIKLLESRTETYENNFEYYLMLGTACLYVGDTGSAITNFQKARQIRMTDSRLLLGQAAIYLKRGDTDRALQYYLEIKENDPENPIAINAIEFIRTRGDFDTICRWVDTGRIKQFYPPLGKNPKVITKYIAMAVAFVVILAVGIALIPKQAKYYEGTRKNLEDFALTSLETRKPQEQDLSNQSYHYILSDKDIKNSYENILKMFQQRRDNAAQIEINRILNSNATLSIKQKAQIVMTYLEIPTFDTITDVPDFKQVEKDTSLYMDCWVKWGGKIADAQENEDGSYTCKLLVGYESGEKLDGIVTVKFSHNPNIATDIPVIILGKILVEDGKIYIKGRAVYQSVKNGML